MDSDILIGIIPLYFRSITDTVRYGKFAQKDIDHDNVTHLQDVRLLLNKSQQFMVIPKPENNSGFKYKSFIKDYLQEEFQIQRGNIQRCKLINDKTDLHLYLVWIKEPLNSPKKDFQWINFLLMYQLNEETYKKVFTETTQHLYIFQELLQQNKYLESYHFVPEKLDTFNLNKKKIDYNFNKKDMTINLHYIIEYIVQMLIKLDMK